MIVIETTDQKNSNCQALSISQSLNLSLSLRDRADTKIRDLFKVKLYLIRSETKKKREGERL